VPTFLWFLGWLSGVAQSAAPAPALRPFADYEPTGYIVMSAADGHGAGPLKRELARHLPSDVTLILYSDGRLPDDSARVVDEYRQLLPADRLVHVTWPKAKDGFWSRDALPVPLVDAAGRLVLTDARYWTGFEPDAHVGRLFNARVLTHSGQFEGGNFLANDRGDCFLVQTRLSNRISDRTFIERYGCRAVTRLPRDGGIGHIDERARFVSPATVVTDSVEYDAIFTARGFRTVRLPRPPGRYETYVNALFVNRTVFMPRFGRATDDEAARVYRRLGFTVVGLDSRALSAKGKGSLHCIAMNYPRGPIVTAAPSRPHLP